jgi:hypothetical protein
MRLPVNALPPHLIVMKPVGVQVPGFCTHLLYTHSIGRESCPVSSLFWHCELIHVN